MCKKEIQRGRRRGVEGQEVRRQADADPVLLRHYVAGPSPEFAASERHSSRAGACTHTQAFWEIRKAAKLFKLQKEKELKGKVLDTHTHAHTQTHTDRAGMTHAQTPSQIQYVLRREEGARLSEMKAEAAGVWSVEHQ